MHATQALLQALDPATAAAYSSKSFEELSPVVQGKVQAILDACAPHIRVGRADGRAGGRQRRLPPVHGAGSSMLLLLRGALPWRLGPVAWEARRCMSLWPATAWIACWPAATAVAMATDTHLCAEGALPGLCLAEDAAGAAGAATYVRLPSPRHELHFPQACPCSWMRRS